MVKFHDLNIPRTNDVVALKHTLILALKFGYDVVAVNTVVEEGGKVPPAPPLIDLGLSEEEKQNFRQLSRVTFVVGDNTNKIFMRSDNTRTYDIVAVQPTTEKSMKLACCDFNVDLISLDFSQHIDYFIKHHNIQAAQNTGKYFEICYSAAISNASCRKHFFSNVIDFIDKKAASNLIISSGAELPIYLRGPYDIANLALLFDMNKKQAKESLTTICRSLLVKARTRKETVKSAMTVAHIKDLPEKDKWKVEGFTDESHLSPEKKRPLVEQGPEQPQRKSKKLKIK